MASTSAPAPAASPATATGARRPPGTAGRVGYTAAAVLNAVMLWGAHQLLRWGWPGFLTRDFDRVLPVLTASLVAGIVVNAALVAHAGGRFRGLTDLVTAGFGLAVGLVAWTVFPFDFSGYARDWTWLARAVLVVGIVGSSIGIVAASGTILRPGRAARG